MYRTIEILNEVSLILRASSCEYTLWTMRVPLLKNLYISSRHLFFGIHFFCFFHLFTPHTTIFHSIHSFNFFCVENIFQSYLFISMAFVFFIYMNECVAFWFKNYSLFFFDFFVTHTDTLWPYFALAYAAFAALISMLPWFLRCKFIYIYI